MKVHKAKSLQLTGCILTIGALDGLHKGHQALIRFANQRAQELNVPLVVYTFDPPPKVFFQHAKLLLPVDEKITMLENLGVQHVIIAPFDANYISQGTDAFIEELSYLHPLEICEGHDFRFGRNREGDITTLRKHFHVSVFDPVLCESGNVISSTRIRSLFVQGKVNEALELLDWDGIKAAPMHLIK
ncbi:FAD synthetase [Pseudogracilibacillus auburnensis]|uniref:FAD synthase n=1 Tax=Pseudogracilibacillus auburnensis TaxID=1494959 RepID=A0A2V3W1Y7_9BACI|nr:FAD synthetase [Pseudogracilibacillus auburnensis]PXW87118.1 riboflavin kinase/FMN adenylyltransferase [Pseudogracilibacillus auburnensis]